MAMGHLPSLANVNFLFKNILKYRLELYIGKGDNSLSGKFRWEGVEINTNAGAILNVRKSLVQQNRIKP